MNEESCLRGKPTEPELDTAKWPKTGFHRATSGAWKALRKWGILIRAKSKSGQRRQNPIEVEVDVRGAIINGVICFKTIAGCRLNLEPYMNIPPEYIISIENTDEGPLAPTLRL